jgi:SulP family sulfate permease
MDLSGVNDIDAVAVDRLSEIMDNYRGQGIQFVFAGMKGPVRDLASKAGWEEKYGRRIEYLSIQHALKDIGMI